jgi:hypothetical protein
MDARGRAIEDAARLAAKVANPVKRDLIVGTLATSMQVDAGVIRNAIARASGRSEQGPDHRGGPRHPNPSGHAPQGQTNSLQERPSSLPPPPDEVEVIALLADHPTLIATAEADKAFWLLTDGRLRAMYSGAREGKSFFDLASEHVSPQVASYVLSQAYVDHKDPRAELSSKVKNLEARQTEVDKAKLRRSLADAQRSGNRDKARLLAQLALAERRGDHEQAARLRESLAEHEPGKQVD